MSYIPTYNADDITGITNDTIAKLIITIGSLAAMVVIAIILYIFLKRRR